MNMGMLERYLQVVFSLQHGQLFHCLEMPKYRRKLIGLLVLNLQIFSDGVLTSLGGYNFGIEFQKYVL